MKNKLLKLLHKIYRKDDFVNNLLSGTEAILNKVIEVIERLANLLHFNRLDEKGCEWWETLLNIVPTSTQTIDYRCSKIRAKWVSIAHNNIKLIQSVCNSWKNGKTHVFFINGKIKIQYAGFLGDYSNLNSIKESIDEIKPAHIAYDFLYIPPERRCGTFNCGGNIL